jgi:hypothetical protein
MILGSLFFSQLSNFCSPYPSSIPLLEIDKFLLIVVW